MDFFGRKFRMFRNESKRVEGFIRVSRVKYALNTKENVHDTRVIQILNILIPVTGETFRKLSIEMLSSVLTFFTCVLNMIVFEKFQYITDRIRDAHCAR